MYFDEYVELISTSIFTFQRKKPRLGPLTALRLFAAEFLRSSGGRGIDKLPSAVQAALEVRCHGDVAMVCRILDGVGALRRNSTVLELGAGRGDTTSELATCGAFTRVLAVEPEPENFRALVRKLADNNLDGVVDKIPCAAGMIDGMINFHVNRTDSLKSSVRQKHASDMPLRTTVNTAQTILDDARVPTNQLGLVWIDIEGYETMACLGLLQVMRQSIPIYVVMSPNPAQPGQTASFLRFLATHYHRCVVFDDESARITTIMDIPTNRVGQRVLIVD
ncbi:FkbM family methyltransferase [Phyllobacterium sp. BT25]|uniref:FkbM family methyltransferase n=1 Tax=Phyllobacterium pellucidum TaxID=2740464 RepID=A0A849VJN7_9HYPH|nr:FkbM family methyltransferase [Phyllobacterium pellucidum]NTS29972.1 FkbM family methyltransferase [Phyllobacterium pellucidum]